MTKRIVMFVFAAVLALAASGQALAQGQSKDETAINEKNTASGQALTMLVPQQCFSSGSSLTFVKVCFTDNGNVSYFESPAGFVHLNGREGYALCTGLHNQSTANGFDVNYAAAGWGTSTVSQPNGAGTLPLIITRQTLDGLYELKQTFTPNWSERGINIKMDVKNMSGSVIPYLRVTRSADIDAAGVSMNTFEMTNDSASGMGVSPTNYFLGLMLTAAPGTAGQGWAWNSTYSEWNPWGNGSQYARACAAQRDFGGYGDYVSGFDWNINWLNPGQTKSATLRYRRF
jgi:hypothetical protein